MNVCKMRQFVILLPRCNLDKYRAEKSFINEDHQKFHEKYKMRSFSVTLPKFDVDKYNFSGPEDRSRSVNGSTEWKCIRCEESFTSHTKYLNHKKNVHYKKMVLPGVNFINVLSAHFLYEHLFGNYM
jgi:hypothetical protein